MSNNTKKRMAAAAAMLSVGGVGLTAGLGGSGSSTFDASAHSDRPRAMSVTDAAPGADAVGGRRIGWLHAALARRVALAHDDADAEPVGTAGRDAGGPSGEARHTITVGLPSYSGGRPPSVDQPTVHAGQRPTVTPGWTTTVDLGEAPSVGAPSVDPGESGTFHRPWLEVS